MKCRLKIMFPFKIFAYLALLCSTQNSADVLKSLLEDDEILEWRKDNNAELDKPWWKREHNQREPEDVTGRNGTKKSAMKTNDLNHL